MATFCWFPPESWPVDCSGERQRMPRRAIQLLALSACRAGTTKHVPRFGERPVEIGEAAFGEHDQTRVLTAHLIRADRQAGGLRDWANQIE